MRRMTLIFGLLVAVTLTIMADVYPLSYEGFPYKKTMCGLPTYTAGVPVMIPLGVPEKDGKKLAGWRYDGQTYKPGDTFIMPEAEVVFVPVWEGDETAAKPVRSLRADVRKLVRDGQMLIVRDNQVFNVLGERLQ